MAGHQLLHSPRKSSYYNYVHDIFSSNITVLFIKYSATVATFEYQGKQLCQHLLKRMQEQVVS